MITVFDGRPTEINEVYRFGGRDAGGLFSLFGFGLIVGSMVFLSGVDGIGLS